MPGWRSRIRRSAQVPGDMWVWFAWEIAVGWAVPAAVIVFWTDWALPVKIALVLLLIPVTVFVVRRLARFMGE